MIMKKVISVILVLAFLLLFAGCSKQAIKSEYSIVNTLSSAIEESNSSFESILSNAQNSNNTISDDKNLLNVKITYPAFFFKDVPDFDPNEYNEKNGYKQTVVNEDGSITVTMSESKYNELIAGSKKATNFSDLVGASGTPYVKAVKFSEGYETVTIDVNKLEYEAAFDKKIQFKFVSDTDAIGTMAMQYQLFNRKVLHCEVIIRDVDSGDIISDMIYPDVLE